MCYLGGSKLSKKSTFKFVPIRNGIEGLAATCDGDIGPGLFPNLKISVFSYHIISHQMLATFKEGTFF